MSFAKDRHDADFVTVTTDPGSHCPMFAAIARAAGLKETGGSSIHLGGARLSTSGTEARTMAKGIWLLTTLLGVWPGLGLAQTADDLVNDGRNTENVTTQSMGYDRKNYSPLRQIDKSNVRRLVPMWSR